MKTIKITGTLRTETGKKSSRELRTNKSVPCVLYGGKELIHFYALESDFRHLVYTPSVYIVELEINGTVHNAVMKDIQFHPVHENILHIDFLKVFDNIEVKMNIPVKTKGFAEGVRAGGVLRVLRRNLKISALPANLPDSLDINIENLGLGKSLKVKDLNFENITILEPANSVVCSVKMTRAAMSSMGGAQPTEGGTATE